MLTPFTKILEKYRRELFSEADAESLRYIPINETMEVKREVYEGEFG